MIMLIMFLKGICPSPLMMMIMKITIMNLFAQAVPTEVDQFLLMMTMMIMIKMMMPMMMMMKMMMISDTI